LHAEQEQFKRIRAFKLLISAIKLQKRVILREWSQHDNKTASE
jgi:hypothetical protein